MTTLVILESPGKLKKMRQILGAGFRVSASVGHVRDLPATEMGVEPPTFKPKYEPTKRGKDVLSRLRKEVASADAVILATDPDREGEAIAWHLADALKLKNPQRVTFPAITEAQVKAALNKPRTIDYAMVRAQEARRSLDRIVGYRVSPALTRKAGQNMSAGRVQSPAVRLVVERERAINDFKPTKHFGAMLHFEGGWNAELNVKALVGDGLLTERLTASAASNCARVRVVSFEDGQRSRAPAPPFTTSALQQAASVKLKLSPKETMQVAQKLYEAGLITYMRTDNPNFDGAGMDAIEALLKPSGVDCVRRKFKAKDGAQEGHEAIRPTDVSAAKGGEDEQQQALYELIRSRAIASMMPDAVYAVRTVVLRDDTNTFEFCGKGRTLVSPGWLDQYKSDDDEDSGEESDDSANAIPELVEDAWLSPASGEVVEKTTKAPGRFTEASLVKELERLGIGRPSTYAAILENIRTRGYVQQIAKRQLQATELGFKLVDALCGTFSFLDYEYTSQLEHLLDEVASGKADYSAVVGSAWKELDRSLGTFEGAAPLAGTNPCPCGEAVMVKRNGSNGVFWGCSRFPKCRVTLPDADGRPGESKASRASV